MPTRRRVILALATGAAAALTTSFAFAAPPTVEIIALPHSPVQSALKPVRNFLATVSGVKVIELDSESAQGEKRIKAVGLKGHMPILLLVNGTYRYKRADGSAVAFKDFPAKADNPLGLNGSWSVDDFEAAVKAALGGK